MSIPLHKRVILSIPRPNHPDRSPVKVIFISKLPIAPRRCFTYIVMSDMVHRRKIRVEIDIPASALRELVNSDIKDYILSVINGFADKIANKYSKDCPEDIPYIKKAIISCYYQVVVDHERRQLNFVFPKTVIA